MRKRRRKQDQTPQDQTPMTTLEQALAFYCRRPTDDEPLEILKAFAAGLSTMRPGNAGLIRIGAVGAAATGICWAVESQMPNLFEKGETIDTWMGFQIPWADIHETSHEDGVFQCTYRALAGTDPKITWEEHCLRAHFGETPDDARTLDLLVTQLRK